ncbi:MAG: zinc metallopeptidase [Lachnospirales bacterium]
MLNYIVIFILIEESLYYFIFKNIINRNFYKYTDLNFLNKTGEEVANKLLVKNHLDDIRVEYIDKELGDCYDWKQDTIFLSKNTFSSRTLSALCVAAHEVGHCILRKRIEKRFIKYKKFVVTFIIFLLVAFIIAIAISENIMYYLKFNLVLLLLLSRLINLIIELETNKIAIVMLKNKKEEYKKVLNVSVYNGIYKILVVLIPLLWYIFII